MSDARFSGGWAQFPFVGSWPRVVVHHWHPISTSVLKSLPTVPDGCIAFASLCHLVAMDQAAPAPRVSAWPEGSHPGTHRCRTCAARAKKQGLT